MTAHRMLAALVATLMAAGLTAAVAEAGHRSGVPAATRPVAAPASVVPAPTTTTLAPTTTSTVTVSPPPPTTAAPAPMLTDRPVVQLGCPPPPPPSPPPPTTEPWHPAVLVPDSRTPEPAAPRPWASDPRAAFGKGMWVWQWAGTEGGDADAVVARARRAGLHQLWVRVGDSQSGFYASGELDQLVAKAHAGGLSVIGWGFPYLYDPVGDAGWTQQALDWRGAGGARLDGFSADIERPSEGVMLTARRVAVYFDLVRRHAGSRLIVATVYPPIDEYWRIGGYPFAAMAPYVDAFAPMVYWECTDPGADARQAVERLSTLRPVHLIGQAYGMAGIPGGRVNAPSAAEILRFMTAGRRAGAIGTSFWVWNTTDAEEWGALTGYPWRP